MQLIVGHRGFALIKHLDVAAKRYGGHGELCAVAVSARPDRFAEAHRKTQDTYPAATRHPVVAELVESNQHAQHHDDRQYVLDQAQVSLLEILPSTARPPHGLPGSMTRRRPESWPRRQPLRPASTRSEPRPAPQSRKGHIDRPETQPRPPRCLH